MNAKLHLSENLTRREMEIFHLFAKGMTAKEIGKSLGISPGTVEKHRENFHSKFRIKKTSQLMAILQEKTTRY